LVSATQRALSEPRAEQPPLEALGRILARSYQLLAQLTSVKTMLTMRRERLQMERLVQPLQQTADNMAALLRPGSVEVATGRQESVAVNEVEALQDPFDSDLTPWMLRRLGLLPLIARQLQQEAAGLSITA
jgi:hypothetical protein